MNLDAHERPPSSLKLLFKKYQGATSGALAEDKSIVDFDSELQDNQSAKVERIPWHSREKLREIYKSFSNPIKTDETLNSLNFAGFAYRSLDIPGNEGTFLFL